MRSCGWMGEGSVLCCCRVGEGGVRTLGEQEDEEEGAAGK